MHRTHAMPYRFSHGPAGNTNLNNCIRVESAAPEAHTRKRQWLAVNMLTQVSRAATEMWQASLHC